MAPAAGFERPQIIALCFWSGAGRGTWLISSGVSGEDNVKGLRETQESRLRAGQKWVGYYGN